MRPPYSHLSRERYPPPPPPLPPRSYSHDRATYERDSHYKRDERPRPYSPPLPPPHYARHPYSRPYPPPPPPHTSPRELIYRRLPPRVSYRNSQRSDRRQSSRPKIDESVRVVENGRKLKESSSRSNANSKPAKEAASSAKSEKNDPIIVDTPENDKVKPSSSSSSNQPATEKEREELAEKEQVVFLDIEEEEEHLMQTDNPRRTSGSSSPVSKASRKVESATDEKRREPLDDKQTNGSGGNEKMDDEIVPEPWTRYTSDKGETYYYNKINHQTVWTLQDIPLETAKSDRTEGKKRSSENPAEKRSKPSTVPNTASSNSDRKQSLSNDKDRVGNRVTNANSRAAGKRHVAKDSDRMPGKNVEQKVERNNRNVNHDVQRQKTRQSTAPDTQTSSTTNRDDIDRRSSKSSDIRTAQSSHNYDRKTAAPSSSVDERAYSSRLRTIERDAYGKIKVTSHVQPLSSRSRVPPSPPSNGRHGSGPYPTSRSDVHSRLRLSPPPSMPLGPPPRGLHPYEHEYSSRYASSRRYGSPPASPPPPPHLPPYHSARYSRPVDRYARYPPAPVEGPPTMHPAYEYSRSSERSPILPPLSRWHLREAELDRRHHEPFSSHHRAPPPLPSHHHHHHPGRGYR